MSYLPDGGGGNGDPIASFMLNLRDVAHELVGRTLGANRTIEGLIALHEGAIGIADLAMERMERMLPPARPIECGKGCAHCCTLGVMMTDPVTLCYLARALAEQADPGARGRFAARLALAERRPCVLLEDDFCSVYRTRPILCRAFNAFDSDACAAGRLPDLGLQVGERAYPVPYGIAAAIAAGLTEGLSALGLVAGQVELNAGLAAILSDAGAIDRWLAGEDVFAAPVEAPVEASPEG